MNARLGKTLPPSDGGESLLHLGGHPSGDEDFSNHGAFVKRQTPVGYPAIPTNHYTTIIIPAASVGVPKSANWGP
jgi:hypothetical protein